jgi:hypothetical protein
MASMVFRDDILMMPDLSGRSPSIVCQQTLAGMSLKAIDDEGRLLRGRKHLTRYITSMRSTHE